MYCATLNCGQIITHQVSTRHQPTRTVCTAADKSQIKIMIEPQIRLWKFNFNQIFEIFQMNLFNSTLFKELSDCECLVGIKLKSKSWQSSSASALSPLRSLLRRPPGAAPDLVSARRVKSGDRGRLTVVSGRGRTPDSSAYCGAYYDQMNFIIIFFPRRFRIDEIWFV